MSRVHQPARDEHGNIRPYLTAAQLAELVPWTVEGVRAKVKRGELVRGVHWFQAKRGGEILFKWSAVEALIQSGTNQAAHPQPGAVERRSRAGRSERGRALDVEKATGLIRGVLGPGT